MSGVRNQDQAKKKKGTISESQPLLMARFSQESGMNWPLAFFSPIPFWLVILSLHPQRG